MWFPLDGLNLMLLLVLYFWGIMSYEFFPLIIIKCPFYLLCHFLPWFCLVWYKQNCSSLFQLTSIQEATWFPSHLIQTFLCFLRASGWECGHESVLSEQSQLRACVCSPVWYITTPVTVSCILPCRHQQGLWITFCLLCSITRNL